jgi:hypothetical protein
MINVAFVRSKKRATGGTLPFGGDRIGEIEKGRPLSRLALWYEVLQRSQRTEGVRLMAQGNPLSLCLTPDALCLMPRPGFEDLGFNSLLKHIISATLTPKTWNLRRNELEFLRVHHSC